MKRPFLHAAFSLAIVLGFSSVRAGDNKAAVTENGAAVEEETPKNWIELGIGGLNIAGDDAQFKQEHRMSGDVFGGIEDMHLERAIGKGTLTIDGRAIFDNHDYDVKVDLTFPRVGYIRAGYTEFRSWYDGNGGFFPDTGLWFAPRHPEDELDRGEAWIELGLRMPKLPEITLHYSHLFRDGRKDSTIWGDSTLTSLPVNPARKLAPAFRNIDETRDIFSAEIAQNFGKIDVGLGMRYEHNETDDRLQLERGAGQLPALVVAPGAQRFITHRDQNEMDSFNGHFTTETHLTDSLWFTTAYFYSTSSADISGTRIVGTDYNSMYGDPILTLQSNDHGVLNLSGMSEMHEHVGNVNLMWVPVKKLTALAAFRYSHEEKDSFATFLDTNTTSNVAPFTATNPRGGFHLITNPTPRSGDTSDEFDNTEETFELRYTGIDNWVLYARGDWEEEWGNVREHEVNGPTDEGMLNKDTKKFSQKYTLGVNWNPLSELNFAGNYFHKNIEYDNDFKSELAVSPVPGSERNQRLLHKELDTDNFNIRMTWRPKLPPKMGTIAFVTRYDYVRGTIDAQLAISPTAVGNAPANVIFDELRTATITNHVFTESITWNPSARLYFQGNFSYVRNETDTPADINLIPNSMPSVVDAQNDYWTAGASMGFVLDDKTDLRAEYSYYRADNYEANWIVGMPYGMDARQHTVGASISREIVRNVPLQLQYRYFHYRDETSGGHNNYDAHAVFSSLLFRF